MEPLTPLPATVVSTLGLWLVGSISSCVVVADQLLNRFFRICGQMLSAIARLTFISVIAHIRTGSHTEFVILRGDIQLSKNLHTRGVKLLPRVRKRFFVPSLYRP